MQMFKCDRCEAVQDLFDTGFGDSDGFGHNRCLLQTQDCAEAYDLCNDCMKILTLTVRTVIENDS